MRPRARQPRPGRRIGVVHLRAAPTWRASRRGTGRDIPARWPGSTSSASWPRPADGGRLRLRSTWGGHLRRHRATGLSADGWRTPATGPPPNAVSAQVGDVAVPGRSSPIQVLGPGHLARWCARGTCSAVAAAGSPNWRRRPRRAARSAMQSTGSRASRPRDEALEQGWKALAGPPAHRRRAGRAGRRPTSPDRQGHGRRASSSNSSSGNGSRLRPRSGRRRARRHSPASAGLATSPSWSSPPGSVTKRTATRHAWCHRCWRPTGAGWPPGLDHDTARRSSRMPPGSWAPTGRACQAQLATPGRGRRDTGLGWPPTGLPGCGRRPGCGPQDSSDLADRIAKVRPREGPPARRAPRPPAGHRHRPAGSWYRCWTGTVLDDATASTSGHGGVGAGVRRPLAGLRRPRLRGSGSPTSWPRPRSSVDRAGPRPAP